VLRGADWRSSDLSLRVADRYVEGDPTQQNNLFGFRCATPDKYGIAGRVVDGGGGGLAGVAVSAGAGYSATTDGNGDYTLTPSKDGYGFCPVSRTVNPASTTGNQNFTGFGANVSLAPGFCPDPHGYGFKNKAAHTSWEIFRDTFGAGNVEWIIGGRFRLV
jgi:hypothetical protein